MPILNFFKKEDNRSYENKCVSTLSERLELADQIFSNINTNKGEILYIISLDKKNTLKEVKLIQKSKTDCINVDMKRLEKYISNSDQNRFILTHNHPGYISCPSFEDIDFTVAVKRIVSKYKKTLVDHIIWTKDASFSFEKNNMIECTSFKESYQNLTMTG